MWSFLFINGLIGNNIFVIATKGKVAYIRTPKPDPNTRNINIDLIVEAVVRTYSSDSNLELLATSAYLLIIT